jgi:hypothetical protein
VGSYLAMSKPASPDRIGKHKLCSKCKGMPILNKKYDAYFCAVCDVWTEEACPDPKCNFCVNRPAKPSIV